MVSMVSLRPQDMQMPAVLQPREQAKGGRWCSGNAWPNVANSDEVVLSKAPPPPRCPVLKLSKPTPIASSARQRLLSPPDEQERRHPSILPARNPHTFRDEANVALHAVLPPE